MAKLKCKNCGYIDDEYELPANEDGSIFCFDCYCEEFEEEKAGE